MTRKLIIHDGRSERELVLVGTLTVGRDPSCHISDLDPLLSRRHAEFVTNKSGCVVRDLGSRNGMLVNGLKVREQLLKQGDLVQLGHLQLRYSEENVAVTAESAQLASATTAHDIPTVAVSTLEDTKPHPPNADLGSDDVDATRAGGGGESDDEPTMAPRGVSSNPDDTAVPRRKASEATQAPEPDAADLDATRVPGARAAAAVRETAGMPNTDFDATGVGRPNEALASALAGNLDQTIAPGSIDLDATFVAGTAALRPAAMPPMEARLTASADLRITTASPGCRAHFSVAPDALVGRPLGEVLAERLAQAAADGPSELTFAVDRSPVDRSLIVVLKAAQVETVS